MSQLITALGKNVRSKNLQGKFDHILCILVSVLAINDHSRAGTFQVITELICMFLESGEHGEKAQLRC